MSNMRRGDYGCRQDDAKRLLGEIAKQLARGVEDIHEP
jgi:hypothetical protein